MRTSRLLPLLRSQTQGSLLAQLYLHPGSEYSLTDLARSIGVSVKTIHHEADRLTEAGLITSRRLGNLRLVAADTSHRLTRPLTDLLIATYGPLPVMTELLAGVEGVDEAFIYGSWAARHAGEPGPVPADLDVLVIGTADLDDLDTLERQARDRLGFDVHIHRTSREAWDGPAGDPFLSHVRDRPLIQLDLSRSSNTEPTPDEVNTSPGEDE
ncbi:winged helix-turn-helix domain-containing protein [Actinopolymorpha alba]|uniref:winged helix-turn-helix domain-containing protein n=1 Tax=Actinopolymorpha alba TaxID=533267 RepID=UPI00036075E5|nr:winged helix-turn-helix domain-containing protein [Actinopolymorpha alba]